MEQQQDEPNNSEIQGQIDRMLSSEVFASRPQLSKLFRHLVDTCLHSTEGDLELKLKEHQIGYAIYPNYDPEKNDVRVNATLLRQRIDVYYNTSGGEDPIIIRIPARGYHARFSYNSRSPAEKICKQAWLSLRQDVPDGEGYDCIRLFDKALELDHEYVPALVGKGEAEIRMAMLEFGTGPDDAIWRAAKCANKALALQPSSWRGHVLLGAAHCCLWNWEEAEHCFDKALALSPHSTRRHSWYAAFLLAVGRDDEALDLARLRANENPEDEFVQVALGLFLYVARRFDEAERHIRETVMQFPRTWLGYFIEGCIHAAKDEKYEACLSVQYGRDAIFRLGRGLDTDLVFVGVECLWQYQRGNSEGTRRAKQLQDSVMGGEFWTYFQTALSEIGSGEVNSSIEYLRAGADHGDPMMVLLHRWPLLDPLRDNPAFQQLVSSMNLP